MAKKATEYYQCNAQLTEVCKNATGKRIPKNFYLSYRPEHSFLGYVPICKDCLFKMLDYYPEDGDVLTLNQLIHGLSILNKPYIESHWITALGTDKERFGTYLSRLNLGKGIKDFGFIEGNIEFIIGDPDGNFTDEELAFKNEDFATKYGQDAVKRWGTKYDEEDFDFLENYYQKMKEANHIIYPQQLNLLEQICKTTLGINKASARLDTKDGVSIYKTLNDNLSKLLTDSGLRPIDKKSAADMEGVNSFSQISAFVEKKGFIKPENPEVDMDKYDEEIRILENFYLQLMNKPLIDKPIKDLGDSDG
jgi:hypothetical protein